MSKRKQQEFLNLYEAVHEDFERFCRARAFADMPFDDLINETLLVAYRKLDKLNKPSSFLSFLIGISIRILSNTRKKKRESTGIQAQMVNNHVDPFNAIDRQNNVAFLHYALSLLPATQSEAIILFEITGFRIKEIMELQNSSESAVKQRLARGRKALAEIIRNELSLPKSDAL